MIVADNYIFVTPPKAASTSISAALVKAGAKYVAPRHNRLETSPKQPIVASIVRHPVDRIISAWDNKKPFDLWWNTVDWVAVDNKDIKTTAQTYWLKHVNHILRFETLQDDWQKFCRLAEISAPLPQLNTSRSNKQITAAQREMVTKRFQCDFEALGY